MRYGFTELELKCGQTISYKTEKEIQLKMRLHKKCCAFDGNCLPDLNNIFSICMTDGTLMKHRNNDYATKPNHKLNIKN